MLSKIRELRVAGKSESDIAQELGLNVLDIRKIVHAGILSSREEEKATILLLMDQGLTVSQIADTLGRTESSVRILLRHSTT